MKTTSSKKTSSFKFLIVSIILMAILISGFVVFTHFKKDNKQPLGNNESGATPTYTTQTEGNKVQVPSDVDPSKIKDYQLITENEQYKIRKLDNTYTITLYAIINRPDQVDMYREQLKEYKKNALDYLTKSGVNVSKVKIIYEPDEATNL